MARLCSPHHFFPTTFGFPHHFLPSHTTLRFLHQKLPVRETIASERRSGERNSDICVWLRAGGEEFHDVLWRKGWNIELGDDQALATRLADHLEDWVCETRFGWGQQRKWNPGQSPRR